MSNLLDEYFLRKEAGFWGDVVGGFKGVSGSEIGRDLRGAAIATGVAAGTAAAVPAAQKIIGAITKRRDFNAMMDANPHLQDMHEANPKGFNNMYSSLRRMNPEFASDPIVAGGLMSRMGDDPEAAANILMEAHRAQRGGQDMQFTYSPQGGDFPRAQYTRKR